ncbi:hypothetical protein EVJ58_g10852 [Rhodofomes roseus]|uniref:Peptidase S53 activation domain-containing protein n=1 Tax=Rhodofomes roseus TaxID=34475 RepID=A0A4Y9XM98_9APHY|nr:hypothetical protein EVJ58_g10852 [Rhodofomes roseus]
MLSSFLVLGLILPGLSSGMSTRRSLQVHETRGDPPSGFTFTGAAAPNTVLTLRFALKQSNSSGIIDALYDVSTPSSDNYGMYLSKEAVQAYMAPTNKTSTAVNAWLSENDLQATSLSGAGDWLSVQMLVSTANDLLGANFSVFTKSATGQQAIRTLNYSIPSDLTDHLDLVHPTVS